MEPEHLNPASLPPGTRLSPWRLQEPLGRGTSGVVYRAVADEGDATAPVALKLALHPHPHHRPSPRRLPGRTLPGEADREGLKGELGLDRSRLGLLTQ